MENRDPSNGFSHVTPPLSTSFDFSRNARRRVMTERSERMTEEA